MGSLVCFPCVFFFVIAYVVVWVLDRRKTDRKKEQKERLMLTDGFDSCRKNVPDKFSN